MLVVNLEVSTIAISGQGATTIAGERIECRRVLKSRGPISDSQKGVNARLVLYGRAVNAAPSRFALDNCRRVRTRAAFNHVLTLCLSRRSPRESFS